MRLSQYLPDFIGGIREFQELDKSHTYELEKLDQRLKALQDNQFIESASSEGLARYEQMLKIARDSDMDIRRFNLLTKFNSSIPFSMRWLQNMLNTTLGQGQYLIDLEPHKYFLTISVVKSKEYLIESLRQNLRKKIPANLILNINILNPTEQPLHIGSYIRTCDEHNL